MRRIVVTGFGVIAPDSLNSGQFWETITRGKSTARGITHFDASKHACQIACEVQGFDPLQYMDKKQVRRRDRITHFCLAAANEAIAMARITPDRIDPDRVGVITGSSVGGLNTLEKQINTTYTRGPHKVSPLVVPMFAINMMAAEIAIERGYRGPSFGIASACASGAHAIGTASIYLKSGLADIMITGGSDACITPAGVAGFCAPRALSLRNDAPEKASRPFDRERDGFVMGEGSGILVLETLESAQKRNAPVFAELAGYAATDDAFHITSPPEGGSGAVHSMTAALKAARLDPEQIDYINAHGTSTQHNDRIETQAIKTVFGDHSRKLKISSTKSTTGHLMGGAGGVEAVASVMAIQKNVVPPTINYENPDPECDLDYVPNTPVEQTVNTVISNSFAFGGQNASLVFKKWVEE
jgi:3-oxoacyl-[acyl-carrier-protein] synthase II